MKDVKKNTVAKPSKKTPKVKIDSAFDFLSESQKSYLVSQFLTKMLENNEANASPPEDKAPVEEEVDFPKVIKEQSELAGDIFILTIGKNYALLIKRKEETITRILCPGTMNPVEQQKDVKLFDIFCLQWECPKTSNLPKQIEDLMAFGCHAYKVKSEYDIRSSISKA